MYQCEATSIEGFVQQLANLVAKGYRFYTSADVPEHKLPSAVDAKLIAHYQLDLSKWARSRRRKAGRASVAYLRFGRTFVIISTEGGHRFRDENHHALDIRRVPFRFHGYSVGSGKGSDGRFHASVSIHPDVFNELLAYFQGKALHRTAETLSRELRALRFSPFARVRRQYLRLLREVNLLRRVAGFELVPLSAIRLRRASVKVFFDATSEQREAA